jgi:hypothetical protein
MLVCEQSSLHTIQILSVGRAEVWTDGMEDAMVER